MKEVSTKKLLDTIIEGIRNRKGQRIVTIDLRKIKEPPNIQTPNHQTSKPLNLQTSNSTTNYQLSTTNWECKNEQENLQML